VGLLQLTPTSVTVTTHLLLGSRLLFIFGLRQDFIHSIILIFVMASFSIYEIILYSLSLSIIHSDASMRVRISRPSSKAGKLNAAINPQIIPATTTTGRRKVKGPKMSTLVILRRSTDGMARTTNARKIMRA